MTVVELERVLVTCQQPGCRMRVETWCPLCRKCLCLAHDSLRPVRKHDCLAGPAEQEE